MLTTGDMLAVLRDALLSLAPFTVRQKIRPCSPTTTLRSAIWLGLAQFALFAFALATRYRMFFVARAHQWGPEMRGTAEWIQSGTAVIVTIEFFLYPLSLLLAYLAIEGFVRFTAGLAASEVVPSLPVVLCCEIVAMRRQRKETARLRSLPPDQFQILSGEKIRISSAQGKLGWNATATVAIGDRWYEIEAEESGHPPLVWVYLLRPAPPGKILRRLEHYELPTNK